MAPKKIVVAKKAAEAPEASAKPKVKLVAKPKAAANTNSEEDAIAKTYVKYDQITHVRNRPGMYIGSVEADTQELWVLSDEAQAPKMEKRTLTYVPGLLKIFDEILVNASDHEVRLKSKKKEEVGYYLKNIRVAIDRETGVIEVTNDGDGIDVVMHPTEGIYVPELIFANLLSSTNYDDTEERVVGGLNGLGSKACNIFSSWFEVETVDATRKLQYTQRYEDGLTKILPPTLAKCGNKKPYTKIRFLPDYAAFKLPGLTPDVYKLMEKRVYDMCAVTGRDVSVFFNDVKIDCKTFEKYADLYLGAKSEHTRVYEAVNDRWEVIASYHDASMNGFEQVSFVNGIWTIRGGKHVDYILNQITKRLVEMIAKKNKDLVIRPQTVKDNLILFVKSTIVNPTFDSQSKETLTTPVSKFGSKAELSDKFIEKLYKSGIVQRIIEISQVQGQKDLKKTDGKKRATIRGIHKLDDANWAGTAKSKECTLILTEGDSAKTMAIAGLSKVGRDRYGVFPLRGKLMNVLEKSDKKIMDNEEIANLKKILGLESGKKYKDLNDLRYGKIMVLCDADEDGNHIKGLLFNLFFTLWPTLAKDHPFITSMKTPIVKATKGKTVMSFYNLTDFENWKDAEGLKGWTIKYYKGLGTSTEEEAMEYFTDLKTIDYTYDGKPSDDSIDLAFNKDRADDRKEWLATYDRQDILEATERKVPYSTFVHKELKHFSNYDLERSIPNVMDGLKTSLRKIIYGCFKKGIFDKEIKVAQLAGYVAENSAYHHGEASLQAAIVGLAQDFVGSNNLNLLLPKGQFGSRVQGGKDASQPRYIFTQFNPLVPALFKKEDAQLLSYRTDDGDPVEPEWYAPILPMVLVNGANGIGTGYMTNVPCYNPKDIVAVLRKMLRGEDTTKDILVPWYCGFTGKIEKLDNGKYVSKGTFRKTSPTKIEITELPIGFWTENFKKMLEDMLDEKDSVLKHYDSNYTHTKVNFTLHFQSADVLEELLTPDDKGIMPLETKLKLHATKPLSEKNMYLFNPKGQITKYETPVDIIREYYVVRLDYYGKRKARLLAELMHDIQVKENKIRFIKETIAKVIDVSAMTKKDLEATLEARDYLKLPETEFRYLIEIPIYKQTKDEVTKLEGEIAACKAEHEAVSAKTPQTMWTEDLATFETLYDKSVATRVDKYAKKSCAKK